MTENKIGHRAQHELDHERLRKITRMVYDAPDCEMREMGLDLLGELKRRESIILKLCKELAEAQENKCETAYEWEAECVCELCEESRSL